jgi:hypothetical protein
MATVGRNPGTFHAERTRLHREHVDGCIRLADDRMNDTSVALG